MSVFIFEQDNHLIKTTCFPVIPNHLNWKNMYFKCLRWIYSNPAPSRLSDFYLSNYVPFFKWGFHSRLSQALHLVYWKWASKPVGKLSQELWKCPFSSHLHGLELQFTGTCNPIWWYTTTHNNIVMGDIMSNCHMVLALLWVFIVSQKQWGLSSEKMKQLRIYEFTDNWFNNKIAADVDVRVRNVYQTV